MPKIFFPSTPKELGNTERSVEPSSPSPKCHKPLAPLTELDTSRKSPENDAVASTVLPPLPPPSKAAGVVPIAPSAGVEPQGPSVPVSEAAVPHASAPTEMPTTTGAIASMTFLLANPTTFPPTTVASSLPTQNASNLCDERLAWMNQTRQVGGSYPPHVFHPSHTPFIPFHENDGGIVAPMQMQRGMDMHRGMYLNTGAYQEDIYRGDVRGDPRGPYGGFYLCADDSGMYPDARDPFLGIRPSPHPLPGPSRRSSVALSDTQPHALVTRPSPHPVPGPSHHPSVHPSPYPRPCIEGREPVA